MTIKLVFVILISVLVLTSFISAEEECEKDLTIYIQFKAFNGENPQEISKYQAPNYREDDLLGLWKIIVLNEGTCKSVNTKLELFLRNFYG